MASKTEYPKFRGFVKWVKVYTPDEFRGAVRWTLNFFPVDEEEQKRLKETINPNKKFKKDKDDPDLGTGEFVALHRPTTKLMKGDTVKFTPPFIRDESGDLIVYYTRSDTGKWVKSYTGTPKIESHGEKTAIGNGSEVEITLAVWQTDMGPGNRLEEIKILDLITYDPDGENGSNDDDEPEEDNSSGGEEPW